MWTITGPFDGETAGQVGHQKTKLLKCGQKYLMSRKGGDLVINDKRISREHAYFIVGGYTADDVANPDAIPTLEVRNVKAKGLWVQRDEIQSTVNPGSTEELQDGEEVLVLHDLKVTVRWQKVRCFESAGRVRTPISIDGCQALGLYRLHYTGIEDIDIFQGINVVRTPHAAVTHHLTPNITLSPALAASLLSAAQFVKPEWLQEIIRLGILPKDDAKSLEWNFALPLETKYRPIFAPSLASEFKTFKTWEPNEERLHMLRKHKFIFVGEKGREINNDYQTLVVRGEGEYETFTVDASMSKWRKILTKGVAWAKDKGGKLHLVADNEAMEIAVGREAWQELGDEAKSLGLQFIAPQNIIQAIAHVDPFWMDSAAPTQSEPPDIVPNTYADEPSIPPPRRESASAETKRVTRASSRAPSEVREVEEKSRPTADEEIAPAPAPTKLLTRRARRAPLSLLDPDDSIAVEDVSMSAPKASTSAAPVPAPAPAAPVMTQSLRSSRLRRRAGTGTQALDLLGMGESSTDPSSLDKYKSLFDESDPDRIAQAGPSGADAQFGAQSITQSDSHTQLRTQAPSRGAAPLLHAVVEEEEEPPSGTTQSLALGTKRKADELGDVEMGDADANTGASTSVTSQSQQRSQKRRAVEDINAVEPSSQAAGTSQAANKPSSSKSIKPPPKSPKKGAPAGKPDTDEKFLKAVNSTKHSKKEDQFDREFNKLRISKPELERDQQEKEWAVLADFGNEGVRGNFMVLMEMDVDTSAKPHKTARIRGKPEWDGKPDFKKFKKKSADRRQQAVELVVSEEMDHGIGNAYWKPSQSQVPSQGSVVGGTKASKSQPQPQKTGRGKPKAFAISVESDDSDEAPKLKTRKAKSAAPASKSQPAPSRRTRSGSREATQPLFLASDDDVPAHTRSLADIGEDDEMLSANGVGDDDEDGMTGTMRTNGAGESSQEVAPRARRTAQKRKAPAPVADDDSDDGTFKGFGRRKKRGRVA
ncbi:hypothetical protein EVG20_g1985 [Dentipellis fragilis]|uniref:FHA domain-containing protein n=1 Tax=Dentipellis fragilis TaxID=205917 RepID=A0A4Y9Z994_9AGAM|nr:hypothetical protein EVG20_g1985 [Dentipellis fragilis]